MRCPRCDKEIKEEEICCSKCGFELNSNIGDVTRPDWKWHLKVLVIIYIVLFLGYLMLTKFLE